jgi:hypothetical protein
MDPLNLLTFGVIAYIAYGKWLKKKKVCPNCNSELPNFRPLSDPSIRSGVRCPKCGSNINMSFFGKITGYDKPKNK